jgi:peptide/nickel transport system permease protein
MVMADADQSLVIGPTGQTRRRGLLATMPRIPALIVALAIFTAVAAPVLTTRDPLRADLSVRSTPPMFVEGGVSTFPLGTDRQGRDILTRVIWGARASVSVGLLAVVLAAFIGTIVGLTAGYFGGHVESLLMRAVDIMLSFPTILMALVLAVTFGPSFAVVVGVLVLFLWAQYARLVRAEVLSIKQRDFVALAQVAGASSGRIVVVHIFPNVLNSIVVLGTLQVGWAIVLEGTLSFLGAGIPPPAATWGGMITEGRQYIEQAWWISLFPGIAIGTTVLAFNLLGDWLRDTLDPKLRQL